jgi:transposase, IS30 family
MRTFNHLSLEEREKYYLWNNQGISLREIGRRLGRSHTTFIREPKRNAKYGKPYIPCLADRKAKRRAQKQRYKAPLKEPLIFLYVRTRLRDLKWSPETISGRLSIDYPGYSIHHETIYRYVYGWKQRRMKLWNNLILHRKRRMKKYGRKVKAFGRLNDAISIIQRPEIINKRLRLGDWETDNMEGKRSDNSSISVTVDRMTRVTRIRKLADHTATTKEKVVTRQIKQEIKSARNSLTVDRGVENSNYKNITNNTGMPVYACNPYHSWEKGTVENTIGRVRRFIPKGNSVDGISQKDLDLIEKIMNSTPRKVLGYLTPYEYFEKIQNTSYTP